MFLHTEDGYIPLANVLRASINWTTERVSILYSLGDGQTDRTVCSQAQWDSACRETVQAMIPAAPGASLIHSWLGDDGVFDVSETVIIAWAQTAAQDRLCPVTVDGVNDGLDDLGSNTAIKLPHGEVTRVGDRSWPTVEEWKADEETRLRKEAEEDKKPARIVIAESAGGFYDLHVADRCHRRLDDFDSEACAGLTANEARDRAESIRTRFPDLGLVTWWCNRAGRHMDPPVAAAETAPA